MRHCVAAVLRNNADFHRADAIMPEYLRILSVLYSHGHEIGEHAHGWGQLVYAASGAIHVAAGGRTWLIPPARAVWLSPGTQHRLRMRGENRLRTVYVPPERCAVLSSVPLGLAVPPLLRELIFELARTGPIDGADPFGRVIGEAFLAALARAKRLPLVLTMPVDRRAARVADAILADPIYGRDLGQLVANSGGSLRTIQRRFLSETGMALSEWRQQARLIAGAGSLLDGHSVTEAALAAGYCGVSAFIHAFRAKFGHTPSQFRAMAAAGAE